MTEAELIRLIDKRILKILSGVEGQLYLEKKPHKRGGVLTAPTPAQMKARQKEQEDGLLRKLTG